MWYIDTIEYNSALMKREVIYHFSDMDGPWGIMLSEVSQMYDFTYKWSLNSKTNEPTRGKQTHRYREQSGGCQKGRGLEAGRNG